MIDLRWSAINPYNDPNWKDAWSLKQQFMSLVRSLDDSAPLESPMADMYDRFKGFSYKKNGVVNTVTPKSSGG
jgi:hypothetical protein